MGKDNKVIPIYKNLITKISKNRAKEIENIIYDTRDRALEKMSQEEKDKLLKELSELEKDLFE